MMQFDQETLSRTPLREIGQSRSRGTDLSETQRAAIITLRATGHSIRTISLKLSIPESTRQATWSHAYKAASNKEDLNDLLQACASRRSNGGRKPIIPRGSDVSIQVRKAIITGPTRFRPLDEAAASIGVNVSRSTAERIAHTYRDAPQPDCPGLDRAIVRKRRCVKNYTLTDLEKAYRV